MSGIQIGQPAPSFRLPAAQGSEIGLEDYRGKQNLIVWLTKGMGCPFCRVHMSQLARSYDAIRRAGTEVLEISVSPLPRARLYARKFQLPFPYLCDPDYRVHREWQLASHPYGPLHFAKMVLRGMTSKLPESEYGNGPPALDEMRNVVRTEEMGFFIVDKEAIVRWALAVPYGGDAGAQEIPTGEQILGELVKLP